MLKVPGFTIIEVMAEQPHALVYRAFSESLKHYVMLKMLRAEFPTPKQISDLENEFELLRNHLGEGIPRAFELLAFDKMRVLVLEYLEGENLSALTKKNLGLPEKIHISLALTKALATLQGNGIIHRDLRPDNIVFQAASGKLQIIDFGQACKSEKISGGNSLGGSLHYMAPEQTGRTQNAVGYRSDYYSLGVTLYQLFAGRLPFSAKDEMEWVHSHIALTETPLHEVDVQIPLPISLIVQKLMKKSPEERYQSGLGILDDLQLCLDSGNYAAFRVGTSDVSAEFRLSTKLFGREAEIKLVNRVLSEVVLGEKRLVLVDGDAGVGKSSLVNEVKTSANESDGYFISGKYDQYRKDVPFSALIQAFNRLVAQVLTEDAGSIAKWKDKILNALGENAAVVTYILPQIELIIGQVPEVIQLDGNEQRQRFQQTFHSFIRACCERGRPLVIFLDDLQWADSASRSLLQIFLIEKGAESLLFMGAYRHGEVGPVHPLQQMFSDLTEKNVKIDNIHLTNLTLASVEDLISASFPVSKSDRTSLAQLVFEKTSGNPFFVLEFLKALYEKHLLHFDPFSAWTWDLEAIRRQGVTSNVLTLLSQKISNLHPDTRNILQLAACFGNYFKVDELKSYNGKSEIENLALIRPAIESGLLAPVNRGDYKFIHDRVQEAAYGLMSAEKRATIHWQIAQHLITNWSPQKTRDGIFYLVNHWNAGAAEITSESDREKSAELNLMAANRAKDSSVYDLAYNYAATGETLLGSDDWKKYERYIKPLQLMRASCEFILTRHEDSVKTFQKVLAKMSVPVEKARADLCPRLLSRSRALGSTGAGDDRI
jgi:serine/threonine protein kinase